MRQRKPKSNISGYFLCCASITRSWVVDCWRSGETHTQKKKKKKKVPSEWCSTYHVGWCDVMSGWFSEHCCVSVGAQWRRTVDAVVKQIEHLLFIARMPFSRFKIWCLSGCSCGGRNFLLLEFHLHTFPGSGHSTIHEANPNTASRNMSCSVLRERCHRIGHIKSSCVEFTSLGKQNDNGFLSQNSMPNDSITFNYFKFCEKSRNSSVFAWLS